jgi:hypothetical protein
VVGEIVEALQALRVILQQQTGAQSLQFPDAAGRNRIALDAITPGLTVTTVTTVGAVTNQANIGTIAANDQVPALMRAAADNLRRNIIVT